MNTATQSIAVGIFAGIASAMLVLSALAFPLLNFLFMFLSLVPVLVAGIGWSNRAGIIALLIGAIILGIATSPFVAALFAGALFAPAAWIAHLTNLARPADEIGGPQGDLAWYPLSRLFLYICGISAALSSLQILAVGDSQEMRDTYLMLLEEFIAQTPEAETNPLSSMEAAIDQFLAIMPFLLGAFLVLLLFFGWYVSARLADKFGRSKRPRDDLPAQLRMPPIAIPILGAGLIVYFVGGGLSAAGLAITGAFTAGFTLSGLAMLHFATRGKPWRLPLLWFAYVVVFIASMMPLVAFFIAGLFGTTRTTAPTSPNKNDTTT